MSNVAMPYVAPVSACIITRGNNPTLQQLLTSLYMAVEQTCVLDNSPDGPPPHGSTVAKWDTGCNNEAGEIDDFSRARNLSFDLATCPWVLWADSDDEIAGLENLPAVVTLGEQIKKATGKEVCFRFPYEYEYHADGSVACVFQRERLISNRDAFTWDGAVHETLVSAGMTQLDRSRVVIIDRSDIVWKHRRPPRSARKSLERNVRIMKRIATPDKPRTLFYLANDYGHLGLLREAWETFIHYFECDAYVRDVENEPEAHAAALQLVSILTAMGRLDGAVQWASKAIEIMERCPEGYFALGKAFYDTAQKTHNRRDWERCCHFSKWGLTIASSPGRQTTMFANPRAAAAVDLYLHYAFNQVGDVVSALNSVRRALAVWPADPHARQSEPVYATHLKVDSIVSAETVARVNAEHNVVETAEQQWVEFGEALERTIKRAADILIVKPRGITCDDVEDTWQRIKGGDKKLKIDFVCGPGWEVWNPEIFRGRGMAGGAEGAVIEISERLARRGHEVIVYAGCGEDRVFNGVLWVNTPTWHFSYSADKNRADVAVIWRNASFISLPNNARKKVLWLHDVYPMGEVDVARMADRVVCMSAWHIEANMKHLNLSRDRFAQTSGGVDFDRFDAAKELLTADGTIRNPHRAVWISSLDRGLNELLDMWLPIRKDVPDAELHIFYGYETWKKIALQNNDEAHLYKLQELLKKLLRFKTEGVIYHDRVGHVELAAELLRSGCWLYPTSWPETFCQAAAEAQAAGLRLVTTPVAALNETVGRKGMLVSGDPSSVEFQKRFVELSVNAMLNTPEEARVALTKIARESYSWDCVADGWETLLQEVSSG